MMKRHVSAILQETFVPKGPSEELARRTGAKVVILCQNVGELPDCSDYFACLDYNVRQLAQAFGEKP